MNRLNSNQLPGSLGVTTSNAGIEDERSKNTNQLAWLWSGHALVSLGFIGMLLPLLPTTVFWIGAAMCYARSSPKLYQQLIAHKRFGKSIQNYLEHGVISNKGKSAALLGMSFSTVLLWLSPLNVLVTLIGLFGLAMAAIYIVTRPSNVLTI
jgi:uncharacterized membrane protein YbaN (DUF454 family)